MVKQSVVKVIQTVLLIEDGIIHCEVKACHKLCAPNVLSRHAPA